ncbi:MAG: phage tail tape measure protein [Arcobacter sp.]|nr:MAG: phage tail tape measure protein [Arcobacter sp.]
MSTLLTLGIVLSATDQLSPILGNATGGLGKLDTQVNRTSANITKLSTASLALGTAISAPLKAAYNDYQELARAQGEVSSLGIDDSGIKSITKSAREFSNEFAGTTAPEFVAASYDIKSGIASLSDTAVGEFTKIAAMTGSATKSSTGEMTSLFASGYGIYRKQFEQFGAATISGWNTLSDEEKDIKFGEYFSAGIASSVQQFKTDGGNMSAALSNLGASATSAGVDFAEQLSILGQLQATMSGSEAATKYRAFLGGAVKANEKLGLSFLDANNNLLSMPEILNQIKTKYGNTLNGIEKKELKDAFGTEEALALIELLYNETDNLSSNIDSMSTSLQNGTAKTEEMAKAMNKGKEWDLVSNKINNFTSKVGGYFAPVVSQAATIIGDVITSVTSWMDEHEELSSVIVTGVAIAGGLLTVLGSVGVVVGAIGMAMPFLSGGIGLVSGSFTFLGTAVATVGKLLMANPIGAAVAVIAGAAYLIYDNWEPISAFFANLWNGITSAAEPALNWLENKIGAVTGVIGSIGSFFGFGDDDKKASVPYSNSTSKADQIRKEVYARPTVSAANQNIKRSESKVVHNTPTYNINVSNPSSNVDVVKAMKEHERRQKNRQYEDID